MNHGVTGEESGLGIKIHALILLNSCANCKGHWLVGVELCLAGFNNVVVVRYFS